MQSIATLRQCNNSNILISYTRVHVLKKKTSLIMIPYSNFWILIIRCTKVQGPSWVMMWNLTTIILVNKDYIIGNPSNSSAFNFSYFSFPTPTTFMRGCTSLFTSLVLLIYSFYYDSNIRYIYMHISRVSHHEMAIEKNLWEMEVLQIYIDVILSVRNMPHKRVPREQEKPS